MIYEEISKIASIGDKISLTYWYGSYTKALMGILTDITPLCISILTVETDFYNTEYVEVRDYDIEHVVQFEFISHKDYDLGI